MSTPRPTVSCIIPFYNAGAYLRTAIASVEAQAWSNWELLLVDDGSTDESTGVAREAAARDSRIVYLTHADNSNHGKSAARNLGLSSAQGSYVAFLDADDVWMKDRLAEHIRAMEANPTVGMIFGPVLYWSDWSPDPVTVSGRQRPSRVPYGAGTLLRPPQLLCDMLIEEAWRNESICPYPSGVTIRRSVAEKLGGFETKFVALYDDVVFFSKLFLNYPVLVSGEVCAKYRVRPDQRFSYSYESAMLSGDWHPVLGSRAEHEFLTWLESYARKGNLETRALRRALRIARLPYLFGSAYPLVLSTLSKARRVLRPVRNLLAASK